MSPPIVIQRLKMFALLQCPTVFLAWQCHTFLFIVKCSQAYFVTHIYFTVSRDMTAGYSSQFNSIQFNSSCPTFTPTATSGKKALQCRECVFKQRRFQFTHENVRVCYFLNCMGHAVLTFRPNMEKTAFTNLQPSCQWFITVHKTMLLLADASI